MMVPAHLSAPMAMSPPAGGFWPTSPLVADRKQGQSPPPLSARQRKQVYDIHVSHFSDGSALHAPSGPVVPMVYDPVHQNHLLELVQANRRLTLPARTVPVQMLLPAPKDMRVTMNAGHGVVLPQTLEITTVPLADERIRRHSSVANAITPPPTLLTSRLDDTPSSASSCKENKNFSKANLSVNTRVFRSASVGERKRCAPSSPRDDLTKHNYIIGGTDALHVISAVDDGGIPNEFRVLSTELGHLDQRDQLCSSVRRRRSSPLPASERKQRNLSSGDVGNIFGRPDRSSPSSPARRGCFWSAKQEDIVLANWPKELLSSSCSERNAARKDDTSFASYTALVDACSKAKTGRDAQPVVPPVKLFKDSTQGVSVTELGTTAQIATGRKSRSLAVSPGSPFESPRRESHSPAGSASRKFPDSHAAINGNEDPSGRKMLGLSQSLSAAESPRRRTESNFSDIFGSESLKRPRSLGARSDFIDTASCGLLDNRAELSRSRSGWSSPRQGREKNFSDLFDSHMPERPSDKERATSPELTVREEERPCWESRIGMEMNAEIARRLKERLLVKSGALPSPRDSLSASERKRLDLSSGSLRKGIGDSREGLWDDGRLGPGPPPKMPTMRMRSLPDSPQFRQRPQNSARERYIRSVLTSDNF